MVAAEQWAGWAMAFDHKLAGLVDDLDQEWRDEVLGPWGFLDVMAADQARRLWPRLWSSRLGGLPPLGRFSDPLPRLALLPRGDVLQRLCVLALARRPGVLRCCIDRSVRAPLQRALGDSFAPLVAMSRQGRPVDALAASWSPIQWACVGHADWLGALQPADEVVREIVRLSLPKALLQTVSLAKPVPAERGVDAALAALAEGGVIWPC